MRAFASWSKGHARLGHQVVQVMLTAPVTDLGRAAASGPPRTGVASPAAADTPPPSCGWQTRW